MDFDVFMAVNHTLDVEEAHTPLGVMVMGGWECFFCVYVEYLDEVSNEN